MCKISRFFPKIRDTNIVVEVVHVYALMNKFVLIEFQTGICLTTFYGPRACGIVANKF